MEKIVKSFGRNPANDVVLNEQEVSGFHARVTALGNNQFLLEDLDSRNGTFLNGQKIKSAYITQGDTVQFSNLSVDVLSFLQVAPPKPSISAPLSPKMELVNQKNTAPLPQDTKLATNSPYKDEFLALKLVWEKYQTDKVDINARVSGKATKERLKFQLGGMIAGGLVAAIFPPAALVSMVGSTLGGTIGQMKTSGINANEELQQLFEKFVTEYKCFNSQCNRHFGNFSWDYYAKEGVCPYCKTSFYK